MQKVIGQTGRIVLSDEAIQYKLGKKRTVRYRYVKMGKRYRAEVIGPFHSALYGAMGFGGSRTSCKAALQRRLASRFGYIGCMMYSDVDEADTTALSAVEIWHRANNEQREALKNADSRPIRTWDSVAVAGQ